MQTETVGFLIFAFIIGLSYIILGYLRRYRKKSVLIYRFKDDINKGKFLRLRGGFDIISGILYISAGLFYHITKPNLNIFMGGFAIIIISVTIAYYFITKKNKIPYI